jgi:archaellum component FlaF (FlaF/FlaG flagellin family)
MGMSVSAASAIMFTTFVILFGVVFGAIDHYQSSTINAQQQSLDREKEIKDMEITLVSVNNTTNQIVLLNSGSSTIDLADVDILLNGTYVEQTSYTTQVNGVVNTDLWAPQEELTIHSLRDLEGNRIKVTINGWASAYFVE